ncbi:unnamed protein product [Linum tenue]|uniref:RRM domain-containing protein n=1 Tax=Linum tenue TaxID=586396 RepID=A0AAV0NUG1_9ROSI|nr:unnamed protein product [Linum tenue]
MKEAIEGMNGQNLDGRNITVKSTRLSLAPAAAVSEADTGVVDLAETAVAVDMAVAVVVDLATRRGAVVAPMETGGIKGGRIRLGPWNGIVFFNFVVRWV